MTGLVALQKEISAWRVEPDDALAQIGYSNEELLEASQAVAARQFMLLSDASRQGWNATVAIDAALKTMYALGFCLGVMAEREKNTETEESQ